MLCGFSGKNAKTEKKVVFPFFRFFFEQKSCGGRNSKDRKFFSVSKKKSKPPNKQCKSVDFVLSRQNTIRGRKIDFFCVLTWKTAKIGGLASPRTLPVARPPRIGLFFLTFAIVVRSSNFYFFGFFLIFYYFLKKKLGRSDHYCASYF